MDNTLIEKREAAWDSYAGQEIEFTISEAFNAGFKAGISAIERSRWVTVESHDELPKSDNGRIRFLAMFEIGEYRDYDLFQNLMGSLLAQDGEPPEDALRITAYKLVDPYTPKGEQK